MENSDLFTFLFAGVSSHVEIPEVKLPFHQTIKIYDYDFGVLERELIRICSWGRANLNDHWNIDPRGFVMYDQSIDVEFNFADDKDAMAFKLRWI